MNVKNNELMRMKMSRISNITTCPICGENNFANDKICFDERCIARWEREIENQEQIINIENKLDEILSLLQMMNQRISVIETKLSIQ